MPGPRSWAASRSSSCLTARPPKPGPRRSRPPVAARRSCASSCTTPRASACPERPGTAGPARVGRPTRGARSTGRAARQTAAMRGLWTKLPPTAPAAGAADRLLRVDDPLRVEVLERVHDGRVEVASTPPPDLLHRPVDLPRRLVRALVGEGVEHVGDADDARRERDRSPREPVISGSVPPLVMGHRDPLSELEEGRRAAGEDAWPDQG